MHLPILQVKQVQCPNSAILGLAIKRHPSCLGPNCTVTKVVTGVFPRAQTVLSGNGLPPTTPRQLDIWPHRSGHRDVSLPRRHTAFAPKPCCKLILKFSNTPQCLSGSRAQTSSSSANWQAESGVSLVLGGRRLQIISDSLPTHQVISRSLCLPFCPITYHTEGSVCQRREPLFRHCRASISVSAGSSRPKANGDLLLQSRGVYYLSKVPSIWRVPPSRPVTDSTCQATTGEEALTGRGRLYVLVLGWAKAKLGCAC